MLKPFCSGTKQQARWLDERDFGSHLDADEALILAISDRDRGLIWPMTRQLHWWKCSMWVSRDQLSVGELSRSVRSQLSVVVFLCHAVSCFHSLPRFLLCWYSIPYSLVEWWCFLSHAFICFITLKKLQGKVGKVDNIVNDDEEAALPTKFGSGALWKRESFSRRREWDPRELRKHCDRTAAFSHVRSWSSISLLLRVSGGPSPRLHASREWSSSSAVRAVKNPPAFPPFLHLMKTRGEDIRPSISRQFSSHVFRWISAHVLSPASSRGIVLPGLISIPQRTRTMEPARAIRRWQAMLRDRPPTPQWLMMRGGRRGSWRLLPHSFRLSAVSRRGWDKARMQVPKYYYTASISLCCCYYHFLIPGDIYTYFLFA